MPERPELAPSYDHHLDVLGVDEGPRGGDQVARVDVVPRRLEEAGEGDEETEEEAEVLDRRRGRFRVAEEEDGVEDVRGGGRVGDPRAEERAEGQAHRGEAGRGGYV